MNPIGASFTAILPAMILVVTGMAVMVVDPFLDPERKPLLAWGGIGGIVAAGAAVVPMSETAGSWYAGLWIVDGFTVFFHAMFLLTAALTILASVGYVRLERVPPSEFVALVLFATTGSLVMCAAGELVMVFIGIEILSIGTYVLVGYRRTELKSNEAALKYFLLGSFASAFFLYGVALIFGGAGSTHLVVIARQIEAGAASTPLVLLATALMIVGLSFKVALAPFHVWAPDVYEGAPTPVTGFMSVGPKAAGFAVLMRLLTTALPDLRDRWTWVIWALAAATMIVGNIVAIAQPGIKRMLAYSSIAHAGYVAVALASGTAEGTSAALFYLLAYTVTNLGAFTVVTLVARQGDSHVALADFRGLGWRRPGLAALLSLFLLSLAGVPMTAGFAGKFLIFRSAVASGLTGLTIIGVLTTVVSFYYYLYVIVEMYMKDSPETFDGIRVAPPAALALALTSALTLYLGILPQAAIDWVREAALRLLLA